MTPLHDAVHALIVSGRGPSLPQPSALTLPRAYPQIRDATQAAAITTTLMSIISKASGQPITPPA